MEMLTPNLTTVGLELYYPFGLFLELFLIYFPLHKVNIDIFFSDLGLKNSSVERMRNNELL